MRTTPGQKYSDYWQKYPSGREAPPNKESWEINGSALSKRSLESSTTLNDPFTPSKHRKASQMNPNGYENEDRYVLPHHGDARTNSGHQGIGQSGYRGAESTETHGLAHKNNDLPKPASGMLGLGTVIDVDAPRPNSNQWKPRDEKHLGLQPPQKHMLTPGQLLLNSLCSTSDSSHPIQLGSNSAKPLISASPNKLESPSRALEYSKPNERVTLLAATLAQPLTRIAEPEPRSSFVEPLMTYRHTWDHDLPPILPPLQSSPPIQSYPSLNLRHPTILPPTSPTGLDYMPKTSLAPRPSLATAQRRPLPQRFDQDEGDSDHDTDSDSGSLSSEGLDSDEFSYLTDSDDSDAPRRARGWNLGQKPQLGVPRPTNAQSRKRKPSLLQPAPRLPSSSDNGKNMRFDNSLVNKQNYYRDSGPHPLRFSSLATGMAGSSDKGLVRSYNEDRITLLELPQRSPAEMPNVGIKLNFFGVYDGHGGTACSEYLQENLHRLVLGSEFFPDDPAKALLTAFAEAESTFLTKAVSASTPEEFEEDIDLSGSCAAVALVVGETCYVANLGDSRMIACYSCGQHVVQVTQDLKPCLDSEKTRIMSAGGKVYQTISYTTLDPESQEEVEVYGPTRVFPGRLSVSRSFGDIDAKDPTLGGKRGVIIAVPQIHSFEITDDLDFIVIASDGVFDRLDNNEVVSMCWSGIEKAIDKQKAENLDELCYWAIEEVMSQTLGREAQDNISTVLACFKKFSEISERMNIQRLLRRPPKPAESPVRKFAAPISSPRR